MRQFFSIKINIKKEKFLKEHDLKNLDLYKYNPDKKIHYIFLIPKDFFLKISIC